MMKYKPLALLICISANFFSVFAQPKKPMATKTTTATDSTLIPVSNADLGTFPYFKTLPNFYANDSATLDENLVYFYNGKSFFTIEGKVSRQNLNIKNSDEKIVSEFGCIQAFDKTIATLGGVKIFTGKFPEDKLKALAEGRDMVELGSKSQIAPSAYYGMVEYVIKTPEKEVWVQLVPYTLASHFYTLLVVEKETPLLQLNTNKQNRILEDLEKDKKAILHLDFEPDRETPLSKSKAELLSLVGVFQAHPGWKIRLECHEAPVGKPEYTQQLTTKRAEAIKNELVALGVKSNLVDVKGMGDQRPITSNDTEKGRWENTRIEVVLQ